MCKTVRFLKEKIENFYNLWVRKGFLDWTQKTITIKKQ